jgi:hypothetical protein
LFGKVQTGSGGEMIMLNELLLIGAGVLVGLAVSKLVRLAKEETARRLDFAVVDRAERRSEEMGEDTTGVACTASGALVYVRPVPKYVIDEWSTDGIFDPGRRPAQAHWEAPNGYKLVFPNKQFFPILIKN